MHIHVLFRNQNPNEVTVSDALKELQENNIDVRQLVEWKADHCQQADSSSSSEEEEDESCE